MRRVYDDMKIMRSIKGYLLILLRYFWAGTFYLWLFIYCRRKFIYYCWLASILFIYLLSTFYIFFLKE